jgi:2,3-bisphosphoglycerate-dependent phosphoglycerate mutase
MVFLVLVRHGESMWNKENKFTGWVDVNLSEKGVLQAKEAGKKIKKLNINFSYAFSSFLIRANRTLCLIIDELGVNFVKLHNQNNHWYNHLSSFDKYLKLPELKVIFSENLNERFYGDLQGLNKDFAREKWGKEQVHIWRRSFDQAPPNGESLKDTYNRSVPFFRENIESILKKGENVLVAAHGNSLRAIIKYLEEVSDEDISNIELETGIPIIYDIIFEDSKLIIKSKKILK